jgi:group II intron reverse transcriptase/maturase
VEERGCRDTEPIGGKMGETSGSQTVSTKLERIAKLAREAPDMAFTTLAHYIDIDWLREAYKRTRKDGAPGVDGQTAEEYAANLEENLQSLLERAKSGTYRAPPVRRVHIPKGDGSQTRPIGVPTFEDKVLQRAVAMILEAVYEQDFSDSSYGFRPERSAHQALEVLRRTLMQWGGGVVVEVDIQKFYDSLGHEHLREILRRRVRDGVLLRLIGKWLNAGVQEAGELSYPEDGSPQGGVISPILSNIYLHEVLDTWFECEVKPRLKGRAQLIRYADDFVIVFSCEEDAGCVLELLPKRFAKYGLTLHPEKTLRVEFRRPPSPSRASGKTGGTGGTCPGTFDLLGFTHYWGLSRKGKWMVKQRTASDRFSRALKRVALWCRNNRHLKIKQQWATLSRKLRGHFVYYGNAGNYEALARFRERVRRVWHKWLNRRSWRARLSWKRMQMLLERYPLPPARIQRPYSTLALT